MQLAAERAHAAIEPRLVEATRVETELLHVRAEKDQEDRRKAVPFDNRQYSRARSTTLRRGSPLTNRWKLSVKISNIRSR